MKINKPKKVAVSETEALKVQLARALADYDNLNKRVEREKEELGKIVSLNLILRLLSVLDILESAQKHLNDQGLGIAIDEFKKVLLEEGLEEVKPNEGDEFNHDVHEAVEVVEGKNHGKIAELLLSGWKFKDLPAQAGGQVVRPAKIKVFKAETKENKL